jgi:hypothetical protein
MKPRRTDIFAYLLLVPFSDFSLFSLTLTNEKNAPVYKQCVNEEYYLLGYKAL